MAKEYERLIQERLNKEFTLILRVAMVIAFIAGTMLMFSGLPIIYGISNYVAAVLLLAFSIYPTRIKTSKKIILLAVITVVIAILSFYGGGFYSSFITLLLLANVLTVLFLRRRVGLAVSIFTVLLMIAMAIYSYLIGDRSEVLAIQTSWGLHIVVFVLFLVVLHQSIYTVKKYLFENIEELEKSITEINQLAYYDTLTGLPNAHKFQVLVEDRLQMNEHNGYMIVINLKSIRLINSTLGYHVGNQTLIDIADVLKRVKKENEIITRFTGNEFGMWIEDVSEEEFVERSQLILDELAKQGQLMKKKLDFYAAYSFLRSGYKTYEDCLREVTLTLAHVKSGNNHQLTSYCDAIEDGIRRKEKIKDLIESALSSGEITLFYQAKCDSRTDEVVGVEALARWKSPELGMVSPAEFIPIIELVNMSKEFGDFVIHRACEDYKRLQEKYNKNIKVSINISPTHIKDPLIVHTMHDALTKYQISAEYMVIEITEDLLIEGINEVKDVLMNLKELGVKISLDDFGTGYSSLSYLGQFDFDEIKIDKTFVDQIDSTERANILIENIIQLSRKFDLSIIAEGVETKEQCDRLQTLGCYIIQGYYYYKPEKL